MSTLIASPTTTDAETRLRVRLRQNAAFSGLGGVIAAVGCVPVADAMGFDQWWLLLVVGVGLVGFAGLVWAAASQPVDKLFVEALEISLADAAWVIGSVVVMALGLLSTFGVVVMVGQAALVAFFGATQALLRRRIAV